MLTEGHWLNSRAQERTILGAALLKVQRSGVSQTVLITGAPGIGKSWLIREWLAGLAPTSQLIMAGRADEYDRGLPYAALRDAVLSADRAGLSEEVLAALERLTRVLTHDAQDAHDIPFQALLMLLQAAPRGAPTVLALEDLRAADEDTLGLIAQLVRGLHQAPLLLILTLRPGYYNQVTVVEALINRQAERGRATLLPLPPFTKAAQDAIIERRWGRAPTAEESEQAWQTAAGNPFYLGLLLSQLDSGAEVFSGKAALLGAEGHRQLLMRLMRPDSIEMEVGSAITVFGRLPVDRIPVLAAALSLEEDLVRRTLDGLVAREILTVGSGGYEFAERLIRDAFVGHLGLESRRTLQGRIAIELAERHAAGRPVDLFELAAYLTDLPEGTVEHQSELLAAAATQAMGAAPLTAASWFEAAGRLLAADDPQRFLLLAGELLGLTLASRADRAWRLAEQVMGEFGSDLPPRLVEIMASTALVSDRCAETVTVVSGLPREQRTPWMRAVLCAALALLERVDDAEEHQRELVGELRAGTLEVAPMALTFLYTVPMLRCDAAGFREVDRWVHESVATASPVDRETVLNLARAFGMWGPDVDLRGSDLIVAENETSGVGAAELGDAMEWYLSGRWERLLEQVPLQSHAMLMVDNRMAAIMPMLLLAMVQTDLEQFGPARETMARVPRPIAAVYRAVYLCAEADLMAREQTPEAAIDFLREGLDGLRRAGIRLFYPWASARLSGLLTRVGHRDQAIEVARQAMEWINAEDPSDGDPGYALQRSVAYGALARATGDVDAGLRSRELAVASGSSLSELHAALFLGGAGVEPEHNLAHAERGFARLGATRYVSAAQAATRRQGLRVRPTPAVGGSLTQVESAVCRLVVEGLTNREIAEDLHYSVKTVEMHLSRVYSRTGYRGRVALVRAIADGEVLLTQA